MPAGFAAELYVHAIAMEREAAARYAEFADRLSGQGNHAVAALFRTLASSEAKHLDELQRRTAGVELPPLTADYSWRELFFPGMTEAHALAIALQAEKGARAFFEHAGRVATDPAARSLAREMTAEEAEHIALIGAALSGGRDFAATT
jgi:rubrerythrin